MCNPCRPWLLPPRSYDMVSGRKIMGHHDLSYRLFFTHRLMIRDLLREIVEEPWVERIDLDSGGLAETPFVSARHESRASDVIWKFQRKDGGEPRHVYVLLEFQSRRPDASMPVRFMGGGGDPLPPPPAPRA